MLRTNSRKDVENTVVNRARKLDTNEIEKVLDYKDFFIAGGALVNDNPNDFDLFGVKERFDLKEIRKKLAGTSLTFLAETDNAITVLGHGCQKIQFCRHWKRGMYDLVESFDFAHCQAAVKMSYVHKPSHYEPIENIVMESFIFSAACRDTAYVGSEYPISSLMRAGKFYRRGLFANKHSFEMSVINILIDIVKRGLFDADDIRRQFNSISEGLSECEEASILKSLLHKNGEPPKPMNEETTGDDDAPF